MYALASKTTGLPVMSLQTAEPVAVLAAAVIDPGTLELIAYRCHAPSGDYRHPILLPKDIRQFALDCLVIDSEDELVEADEVVRLQHLLKQNYTPLHKSTVTELGRRLGTVEDYTINLQTYRVQKLYIKRPLLQAWIKENLIIDRSQIIDVTAHRIVVRDVTIKAPALATEPIPETHS